jgi:hypothetical protein
LVAVDRVSLACAAGKEDAVDLSGMSPLNEREGDTLTRRVCCVGNPRYLRAEGPLVVAEV